MTELIKNIVNESEIDEFLKSHCKGCGELLKKGICNLCDGTMPSM